MSAAESAWNASHCASAYSVLEAAPTVVLITSNLQHDFFTRFPKRRETMNRFWVGRKESERVLGLDPARGPLAQLMAWIRGYAAGMPASAIVPNFQDEVAPPTEGLDEAHDNMDADLDREMEMEMEMNAPDLEIDLEQMEEDQDHDHRKIPGWEARGVESGGEEAPTPTLHLPPSVSARSPSVSSLARSQLRSPNVTISPSPAPSSPPSTPSPTPTAAHHTPPMSARLPHRKQPSMNGLPPPHSASHASMSSIASAASVASATTSAGSSPHTAEEFDRPSIYVIHLRTCIDKSKPASASSIERYGEYCLSGSDGVRLCNKMDENLDTFPNECIINTDRMLSPNTYRALKKKLQQIRSFVHKKNHRRLRAAAAADSSSSSKKQRPALKLAVIGGWTDEDVYHLCYELRTRLSSSSLATCSQLTASPSPSQHWSTLSQLKRVMNVTVTRTIKELIGWFGVGLLPYRLPGVPFMNRRLWPTMEWNGERPHNFHLDIDGEIMAHLYRNSSRIVIDTLVGGYSPSIVLSVNSVDRSGVREAPTVVKLASREDAATEYQAFQRIEEMLGNNAPSVRQFVELGDRGAMKFRYTRMAGGKVRTLKDLFDHLTDGEGVAPICSMIDEIYGEIFGGWYGAAQTSQFDLYSYYFDGWAMSHGEAVSMVHQDPRYLKQFITYVLSKPGTEPGVHFKKDADFYAYPPYEADTFQFPHCAPLTNLGMLFEKSSGMPYLRTLPPRRLYSTFAHGDANLQNFLLDTRGNIWVIDFFFTEPRNHVLRDMAKTWSCIMYIAMEITSDKQFAQAFLLSEEMAAARDLHAPLRTQIPGLTDAHLKAIYAILQRLWGHVGRMVKDRSYAVQFQLALVAEAMRHFLYNTRNMYSKRWALATAVLLSESVLIQEKRIHDVTPSWLPLDSIPMARGSLGMTRVPGNRNLMRFERRVEQPSSFLFPNSESNHPTPSSAAAPFSPLQSPASKDNSSSAFRRELTQEERALKENVERVAVSAKQALAHGADGSPERLAWEARLDQEFAVIMQSQELMRSTYERELLALQTRRQRSTQAEAPREHKSVLDAEEEEDDDEPELEAPEPSRRVSFDGDESRPASTSRNSSLKRAHRGRSSMSRSHGSLAEFFENGGEQPPVSDSATAATPVASSTAPPTSLAAPTFPFASTIVQSISHPALRSQLTSVPSALSSPVLNPPSAKRMPRLQKECLRLKQEGVTHLLLLLTDAEFKEMGVDKAKLHQFMSECGIQVITVSMPPGIMQVPLLMDLVKFSLSILCDERKYKLVLVSKGGFHRAGTVAACILCAFGQPPEQAIRTVRECRGSQAIGRDSRERNVTKFDLQWKNLLISQIIVGRAIGQTGQSTQEQDDQSQPQAPIGQLHNFAHAQSYAFL